MSPVENNKNDVMRAANELAQEHGISGSEGWKQLVKNQDDLNDVITNLDGQLNSVLRK